MVEAVFLSAFFPLVFLAILVKGENRRLLFFIMWGIVSALLAYYANNFLIDHFDMRTEVFTARVVPMVEELVKPLPILAFLFIRKGRGNYAVVRYSLAAGIGFSILENYYYLAEYLQGGAEGAVAFVIVRSLSAVLLHGVLSALTGYAVQQMILYGFFSPLVLAGTYGLAVLVHSAFNLLALLPEVQMSCVAIPAVVLLLEVFAWNLYGRTSTRIVAELQRERPVEAAR